MKDVKRGTFYAFPIFSGRAGKIKGHLAESGGYREIWAGNGEHRAFSV